ncbi:MAG: hypothetical protein BGO42_01680 [Flavobacterium sp. 40-81]|nr:MAG: hypothetical protein BGO42_01680 [Flavobacterium sp. 40-81]
MTIGIILNQPTTTGTLIPLTAVNKGAVRQPIPRDGKSSCYENNVGQTGQNINPIKKPFRIGKAFLVS